VRMNAQRLVIQAPARPTPFAFPLMVERFREKLSNEDVADRIARMVMQLEKAAGDESPAEVQSVQAVSASLRFGVEAVDAIAPSAADREGAKPRRAMQRRRAS